MASILSLYPKRKAEEEGRRAEEERERAERAFTQVGGAILTILKLRGIALNEEQGARVLGCTDLPQLERWLQQAPVVASAEALFGDAGD